jgi:hypothetical protein
LLGGAATGVGGAAAAAGGEKGRAAWGLGAGEGAPAGGGAVAGAIPSSASRGARALPTTPRTIVDRSTVANGSRAAFATTIASSRARTLAGNRTPTVSDLSLAMRPWYHSAIIVQRKGATALALHHNDSVAEPDAHLDAGRSPLHSRGSETRGPGDEARGSSFAAWPAGSALGAKLLNLGCERSQSFRKIGDACGLAALLRRPPRWR